MKRRKIFAVLLAATTLTALTPVTAFAADTTVTQNSNPKAGDMTVAYDVAAKYTVTIPAGVTMDDSAEGISASITASDVMLKEGSYISVKLDAASNTTEENATEFHAMVGKSSGSVITYNIKDGNTLLALGSEIAALDSTTSTKTLTFAKTADAAPSYAGTHTETLTFTISVVGGAETPAGGLTMPVYYDDEPLDKTLTIPLEYSVGDTWADVATLISDEDFDTALKYAFAHDTSVYPANTLYYNPNIGVIYYTGDNLYMLGFMAGEEIGGEVMPNAVISADISYIAVQYFPDPQTLADAFTNGAEIEFNFKTFNTDIDNSAECFPCFRNNNGTFVCEEEPSGGYQMPTAYIMEKISDTEFVVSLCFETDENPTVVNTYTFNTETNTCTCVCNQGYDWRLEYIMVNNAKVEVEVVS